MSELKRIGALSAAKIVGLMYLVIGLIIAVIVIAFEGAILSALSLGPLAALHISANSSILFALSIAILVGVPIAIAILEFLSIGVLSCVYNYVASKTGGIKCQFTKNEVRDLDVLSVATIMAFVFGAFILIVSIVVFAVSALFMGPNALLALGMGIIESIAVAVLYFVLGAIFAVIYNFCAKRIGGITLYLKRNEISKIGVMPYAKIKGIFAAIIGFVYGLILSVIVLVFGAILHRNLLASHPFIGFLGAFSIIIFPIGLFIVGFVTAGIEALLYNWLAPKVHGIKINGK
jgi:hypothetical protein